MSSNGFSPSNPLTPLKLFFDERTEYVYNVLQLDYSFQVSGSVMSINSGTTHGRGIARVDYIGAGQYNVIPELKFSKAFLIKASVSVTGSAPSRVLQPIIGHVQLQPSGTVAPVVPILLMDLTGTLLDPPDNSRVHLQMLVPRNLGSSS